MNNPYSRLTINCIDNDQRQDIYDLIKSIKKISKENAPEIIMNALELYEQEVRNVVRN